MKNTIFTLVLLLPFLLLQAQKTEEETPAPSQSDSTVISVGKKKVVVITSEDGTRVYIDKNAKTETRRRHRTTEVDFIALDLGLVNYIDIEGGTFADDAIADPRLEVKPFRPAAHVALHFFPTRVGLLNNTISLKTALTIDWSNYYFTHDITLEPGLDSPHIVDLDPDKTWEKTKLMSRYFQIPILLSFNTDGKYGEGLEIAVGGYAGVLWGGRAKYVNSEDKRVKINDEFNLNPWRYGFTARVHFDWLGIYTNLHVSELFDDQKGPRTSTITAGLSLLEF